MIAYLKFLYGKLRRKRAGQRPQVSWTTNGSPKWGKGHCVGCVLYAPASVCICHEFDTKKGART